MPSENGSEIDDFLNIFQKLGGLVGTQRQKAEHVMFANHFERSVGNSNTGPEIDRPYVLKILIRSGSVRGRFGVRSGSARALFGVRSRSVRGAYGVHAGSVQGLFGVCSGSVRDPFGVCSESVRAPKRKTPMYY